MIIKPFQTGHAYEILYKNVREENIWLSRLGDFEDIVKIWKTGGPSYSLFIDNQVVFCAGVVDMLWQRGEAWTLLSSLFYKHPRVCARIVKSELGRIIKDHDYKRVQSIVEPEDTKAIRFIEWLGFEREGLLRKYMPSEKDMLMYARIQ
jgi:hypothetical protein